VRFAGIPSGVTVASCKYLEKASDALDARQRCRGFSHGADAHADAIL
jgi:hypothetical protein